MTNKQVIEQLESIKKFCAGHIMKDDPLRANKIWQKDIEALDISISTLKYLIDHYKLEEGDNFDT